MLSLNKDLFVRMAISAQRDRARNSSFKVIHVDKWHTYNNTESIDTKHIDTEVNNAFKEKLNNVSSIKPVVQIIEKSNMSSEKIDDKVNNIIDNTPLAQIKAELEFAEALLKKIKVLDEYNIKIPIIEETISRLKIQLEQKSYV